MKFSSCLLGAGMSTSNRRKRIESSLIEGYSGTGICLCLAAHRPGKNVPHSGLVQVCVGCRGAGIAFAASRRSLEHAFDASPLAHLHDLCKDDLLSDDQTLLLERQTHVGL